jgi:radical SAM protein with 4Fe4S-binding SPASM domain
LKLLESLRGLALGGKVAAPSVKAGVPGAAAPDLSWVPAFWASVRDYIFVREEDDVVILPPNLVYKTNATGVRVLKALESGARLERIEGLDAAKLADIAAFLGDIRDLCDGKNVATAQVPYGFDFTRLPILGEIAVTYRCNNRCLFCYAGCGGGSCGHGGIEAAGTATEAALESTPAFPSGVAAGELGTAELKRVIDIFRDKAKIPFFSFTGGEPLLRKDLEELIAYAGERRLRVNLITNGTLASPERARSLHEAGLRTAQVSLESPDAAIHDALCGAPGSHAATLGGIAALREAGVKVQTNSTLTRRNRESLLGMPGFLRSLGVERFSMNLYIPSAGSQTAPDLFVPYEETGSFVDEVRARAAREGLTFFWYSPTPLCIYNPVARGLGNKSCAAADGLLSVAPSGDVLPCSSYPESLGNLLERDFGDIWFSQRAAHFKNKRYAPEACAACASFTACQAACPLYWAYAGYGELERAAARKGG